MNSGHCITLERERMRERENEQKTYLFDKIAIWRMWDKLMAPDVNGGENLCSVEH